MFQGLSDMIVLQFDVTFPALPCEWISLDLMDISGELHLDVVRLSTNLHSLMLQQLCDVPCTSI